jgi:hypothetical protein
MARLDEQKDTPIVHILDSPTLPLMKSSPRRMTTVLLAGVVALIAMISIITVIENIRLRCRKEGSRSLEILRHSFSDAFPKTETTVNRIRHRLRRQEQKVT